MTSETILFWADISTGIQARIREYGDLPYDNIQEWTTDDQSCICGLFDSLELAIEAYSIIEDKQAANVKRQISVLRSMVKREMPNKRIEETICCTVCHKDSGLPFGSTSRAALFSAQGWWLSMANDGLICPDCLDARTDPQSGKARALTRRQILELSQPKLPEDNHA